MNLVNDVNNSVGGENVFGSDPCTVRHHHLVSMMSMMKMTMMMMMMMMMMMLMKMMMKMMMLMMMTPFQAGCDTQWSWFGHQLSSRSPKVLRPDSKLSVTTISDNYQWQLSVGTISDSTIQNEILIIISCSRERGEGGWKKIQRQHF